MTKKLREEYLVTPNNKIQLPCLWDQEKPEIKSNFDYARSRLKSLITSKIMSDKNIAEAYDEIF